MNISAVKNNYMYVTYLILKEFSSMNGYHLSAKTISEKIGERYGVTPNVKSIFTAIDELIEFNFDVRYDTSKKTRGYYLGERDLSNTDFQLLIDGIESIENIPTDDKIRIYSKLCNIMGKKLHDVENFLYDKRDPYNFRLHLEGRDEVAEAQYYNNLNLIFEAIDKKRRLYFFNYGNLKNFLLMPVPDEVDLYLQDVTQTFGHTVNPYKIFRNIDNEMCLLFYVNIFDKTYVGAIDLWQMEYVSISEKKLEAVDIGIFNNFRLKDYKDAFTYREQEKVFEVSFYYKKQPGILLSGFIDANFYDLRENTVNGRTIVNAKFKMRDKGDIVTFALNDDCELCFLPGNAIYDSLRHIKNSLNRQYPEL